MKTLLFILIASPLAIADETNRPTIVLNTNNKNVLESAQATSMESGVVTIMHAAGIMRIPVTALTLEQIRALNAASKDFKIPEDWQGQQVARQKEAEDRRDAAREAAIKSLGSAPEPNADGTYPSITKFLKKALSDPDSLRVFGSTQPVIFESGVLNPCDVYFCSVLGGQPKPRDPGWGLVCDWGARNKNGGMVREKDIFIITASGAVYSPTMEERELIEIKSRQR